jgi:hypothetical protein
MHEFSIFRVTLTAPVVKELPAGLCIFQNASDRPGLVYIRHGFPGDFDAFYDDRDLKFAFQVILWVNAFCTFMRNHHRTNELRKMENMLEELSRKEHGKLEGSVILSEAVYFDSADLSVTGERIAREFLGEYDPVIEIPETARSMLGKRRLQWCSS